MDKFSQLVEDLKTGALTYTHVQGALRASIRGSEDIPEGVKDLLCGRGPRYSGLIYGIFKLIPEVIGTVELAYRRGSDK